MRVFGLFALILSSSFVCHRPVNNELKAGEDGEVRQEFREFFDKKTAKLPFLNRAVSCEQFSVRLVSGKVEEAFVFVYSCDPKLGMRINKIVFVTKTDSFEEIQGDYCTEFQAGNAFKNLKEILERVDTGILNAQYRASLGDVNGQFVLKRMEKLTQDSQYPSAFREFNSLVDRLFVDIFDDSNIKFESCVDDAIGGQPAKRLELSENTASNKTTIWFATSDGRCLKLQQAAADQPDKPNRSVDFFYQMRDGVAIPDRTVMEAEMESGSGPVNVKIENCFRNIKFESLDREQFHLSHYGIPEPDWYAHPRPWWLYVSVFGVFFVVAGALILRFGKSIWRNESSKG